MAETKVKEAKPTGNAGALRAGAIVFWILAIACEALAYIQLSGVVVLFAKLPAWTGWIFLGADLLFVIIGSLMWKRANRIKPAHKKDGKVKFWLWNNMGLIVAIFAFLPFIILILTNKDMNTTAEGKKTRKIAIIVGVVALAIAALCGIEYDPVDADNLTAVESMDDVYWTQYGKVYHLYQDCSALSNATTELTHGTAAQAIENNRKRICKFCYDRAGLTDANLLVEQKE